MQKTVPLDIEKVREDFPILKRKINGKPIVYLDNAATSQKPRQVIETVERYYEEYNANIHRGIYSISEDPRLRTRMREPKWHASSTLDLLRR